MVVGAVLATNTALAAEPATTRRDLPAVRLSTPPVIDGDLSDPCWQHAAKSGRFVDNLYGNPVADQTEVWIGYTETHIYVAFHAYDAQPGSIVARETKRGTMPSNDDYFSVSIDPFHSHNWGGRSWFAVNPIGTQFAHLASGRGSKLEWEGAWQAASRIVADGWQGEMAIPWRILNYPISKQPVTCGLNFNRLCQRTKINSWWCNIGPQETYELEGHWVGVVTPKFRRQLSLLPYAIPVLGTGAGSSTRAGIDARYTLTPGLTAVATLLPDFSTVEGAVETIDFSYGQRYVPDRRPFFQEGSEVYNGGGVAGRYFHSGRIPGFDMGTNIYGRLTDRDTIGVLTAVKLGSRVDSVLRGRHEFGPTTTFDFALISRDGNPRTNRVLVFGENLRRGRWGVDAAWAASWGGDARRGATWNAFFYHQAPRFFFDAIPHAVSAGFCDDLGFIPFTGYRGVIADAGYVNQWRKGPIRDLVAVLTTNDSRKTGGGVFRRTRTFFSELSTRSDYGLTLTWDGGRYEEFNDAVWTVALRVRASDPYHHYGIGYSWGRQAGAYKRFVTPSAVWRWGRLTLGVESSILSHKEHAYQHIVTANYDITERPGIGGRLVASNGGTGGYLAFRDSGYGGVERYLVFGDPNANRLMKKVMLKTVWPL